MKLQQESLKESVKATEKIIFKQEIRNKKTEKQINDINEDEIK